MNKIIPLALLAILLITSVFSQVQEEIKLKGIKVEGNTLTNSAVIIFTSGLKENNILKAGDFSRGIKQLWKSGLFNDVQIYIDEETEEGISVIITVDEAPVFGELIITGDDKISKTKIGEAIGLRTGQRIPEFQIVAGKSKLLDLYTEEGYLLASVDVTLEEAKVDTSNINQIRSTNTHNLKVSINEGSRVKINKIMFTGNENISNRKLRRVLKDTKQQRWYLFWRSSFDQNKFQDDQAKLIAHYQKRGFRDAMVVADSVSYSKNKKKMDIWLTIKEGSKYFYRNFSWDGNDLYEDEQLNNALGISNGEAYNEEDLQKGIYERAQSLYMDKGYIYSNIIPEISPVGDDSIDIHFSVIENHKVYVRNINISGNTRTHENVIRRELKLYPGDVFSRQKLIRSQREVWILNYFGNVIPDVLPVDDDKVDLEITVEEKSSERANLNVGYTKEYGMTGGGGIEFMNFRGRGQKFMLSASTGLSGGSTYNYTGGSRSKYHSFSLSFTDPMINDTPNLVGGSLFYSFRGASTQYYYPLDLKIMGGSLMWGRRFRWPDDFFRGQWGLQITKKVYNGTQSDLDLYTGGLEQSVGVNISQTITRDSRDRPEFTSSGSRIVWNSSLSGGILGGNEDYQKHKLSFELYSPLVNKFVLVNSFDAGIISKIETKDDEQSIIPYDERFIMGGNGIPYGNMLRGYDDNTIGPISSSGSPIGGNSMLKFTVELRFALSENPVIYTLAFAEMGNVWADKDMAEPFYLARTGPLNLKRAAGVGIRFFMPMIGMLGFDLGYGFDDITGSGEPQGWKTTITFGQQF
ncbi:MAG: outer membrane protein assembly factor BamA [Candidatus Neomarinimicrobiota bacterium]